MLFNTEFKSFETLKTHSYVMLFVHSFIRLFVYSLVRSFCLSFDNSFIRFFISLFFWAFYSFAQSFVCRLFIRSFISLSITHWFVLLFINSLVHSFGPLFVRHLSILNFI